MGSFGLENIFGEDLEDGKPRFGEMAKVSRSNGGL